MNNHTPSLMVAVVGSDRMRSGVCRRFREKLQRRGLRAHILRSWRETDLCDCDILLVACPEKELETLAQEIEHLWTQKWATWYASARATAGGDHHGK